MRIASGIALAVAAALFVFWFGWVRAPGPQAVCEHITEVARREAQDRSLMNAAEDALVESIQRQCVQDKLDRIQLRGRIAYADYAKCIMGASTLADIGRC